MTPFEELRVAAQLMRERATAATPGPWLLDRHAVRPGNGQGALALTNGRLNAEHITSWHPVVAFAVADLLENISDDMHDHKAVERTHPRGDVGTYTAVHPNNELTFEQPARWDWTSALALARAYLATP